MTVEEKTRLAIATAEQLIDFECEIAQCFNNAEIRAPVHLYHGNEHQIINIFNHFDIGENDWVLCSWRSHYQCLLKGVPQDRLKKAILSGQSISLCFKDFRVLSSGIVTGVLPIAVGLALDIQRKELPGRVFVFMGDMTSETGIAHESIKYSRNFSLPIHFVVEDNGKSVCTNTREAWGKQVLTYEDHSDDYVTYYRYCGDKYPHAGAGKRVQF